MRSAIAILVLTFLGGCTTMSDPIDAEARPATDLPARFEVAEGAGVRAARPGEGCRSPMIDPRDNTRLVLVRAFADRGDYQVPEGKYGVRRGELLRLECSTGLTIGIVRD